MFSEKNLPRTISDADKLLVEKGELLLKPINLKRQKKIEFIAVGIFLVLAVFMYFIDIQLDEIKKNCEMVFGMLPQLLYLILLLVLIVVGAVCYILTDLKRYKKSLKTGFRYDWKKRRKNHLVFVKINPKTSKQFFLADIAFVVIMVLLLLTLLVGRVYLQYKSLDIKNEFFSYAGWNELNYQIMEQCKTKESNP